MREMTQKMNHDPNQDHDLTVGNPTAKPHMAMSVMDGHLQGIQKQNAPPTRAGQCKMRMVLE